MTAALIIFAIGSLVILAICFGVTRKCEERDPADDEVLNQRRYQAQREFMED